MTTTFRTKNGYSGTESVKRKSSLLSQLIVYIASAERSGILPTRVGFRKSLGTSDSRTFGKNLLMMANRNGYVKQTGRRTRDGKVLTLGPNANKLAIADNLRNMGITI